jgi:hypothetical protein
MAWFPCTHTLSTSNCSLRSPKNLKSVKVILNHLSDKQPVLHQQFLCKVHICFDMHKFRQSLAKITILRMPSHRRSNCFGNTYFMLTVANVVPLHFRLCNIRAMILKLVDAIMQVGNNVNKQT